MPPTANQLTNQAWKLAVAGDNEKAIGICHELCKMRGSTEDYNILGVCYYNIKNYEEALKAYNKAIELDPRRNISYLQQGSHSVRYW